jgi:soluble lytic murein transglycosylase-like protein
MIMSLIRTLINEMLLQEYERVQSVFKSQPAKPQAPQPQVAASTPPAQAQKPQTVPATQVTQQPTQTATATKDTFLDKRKSMFAFGPKSNELLASSGYAPDEIAVIVKKLHTMTLAEFLKYDQTFKKVGAQYGLQPSLLKAMALEETALLSRMNTSGSTAAGLLQMTQGTLDTFNKNLPKGVHYQYETLLGNPSKSIEIAGHYIKHFLVDKLNLTSQGKILGAYKTGPDSKKYARRVIALKKFIDLFGI